MRVLACADSEWSIPLEECPMSRAAGQQPWSLPFYGMETPLRHLSFLSGGFINYLYNIHRSVYKYIRSFPLTSVSVCDMEPRIDIHVETDL